MGVEEIRFGIGMGNVVTVLKGMGPGTPENAVIIISDAKSKRGNLV